MEETDQLFLRLVQEQSLLSEAQIAHCKEAASLASQRGIHKTLMEAAVDEGLLSSQQAEAIYQELMPSDIPRKLGHYEVVSKIGEGGMGAVYKVRHSRLGSYAAVKFISSRLISDKKSISRFQREARLSARLTSPYTVRVFDVGEEAGQHYILMEYVDGQSLENVLQQSGAMDETPALSIARQVAWALKQAHDLNIIHRDIKPANILLNRWGEAKVADFGVGKFLTGEDGTVTITQEGGVVGTPSFMSPEQAQGFKEMDHRSDIYSLGASLYYMVVGKVPFKGETPQNTLHKVATEPVPDPRSDRADLSKKTAGIICKMMAKDPEQRYQDASELLRDIEAALAGRETLADYSATIKLLSGAEQLTPPTQARPTRKRGPVFKALSLGATILVFLLAAAALVLRLEPRARPAKVQALFRHIDRRLSRLAPAIADHFDKRYEQAMQKGLAAENDAQWLAAVRYYLIALEHRPTDKVLERLANARHQRAVQQMGQEKQLARKIELLEDALAYKQVAATARMLEAGKALVQTQNLRQQVEAASREADNLADIMATDPKARDQLQLAQQALEKADNELEALSIEHPDCKVRGAQIIKELRQSQRDFEQACRLALLGAYPEIARIEAPGRFAEGLLGFSKAQLRYPNNPQVKEMLASPGPVPVLLPAANLVLASEPLAEEYASTEEADVAAQKLLEALKLCEQAKRDKHIQPSAQELAAFIEERLAATSIAQNKYLEVLMHVNRAGSLQRQTETLTQHLDLAIQGCVQQFATLLDEGKHTELVRMLKQWDEKLPVEEFQLARTGLRREIRSNICLRKVFSNRACHAAIEKVIGELHPEEMVFVEEAEFPLGQDHPGLDSLWPNWAPRHKVQLEAFWVDKCEVTNEQFQGFVDEGGYQKEEFWDETVAKDIDRKEFLDQTGKPGPKFWVDGHFPEAQEKLPVTGISWYEACAFARWEGKRLPTEAEWECAASWDASAAEPDKRPYPWGSNYHQGYANLGDSKPGSPVPVGSYPEDRSPAGCVDLAGNVREWTASAYEGYPETKCNDERFATGLMVVRGAGFRDPLISAVELHCRRASSALAREPDLGFRCAWNPLEKSKQKPDDRETQEAGNVEPQEKGAVR